MKKYVFICCMFLVIIVSWNSIRLFILKQDDNTKFSIKELENELNIEESFTQSEEVITQLYEYLKIKGWKLGEIEKTKMPMFDSKKTIVFRLQNKRVNFLIMQFDSEKIAKERFPIISKVYEFKYGGAITERNFVISFLGRVCFLSTPPEMALEQNEISKLQQDLREFFNLYHKTLFTKFIRAIENKESNKRCSGLVKSAC